MNELKLKGEFQVTCIVTPPTEMTRTLEEAKAECWDNLCTKFLNDSFSIKDIFEIAFECGYKLNHHYNDTNNR